MSRRSNKVNGSSTRSSSPSGPLRSAGTHYIRTFRCTRQLHEHATQQGSPNVGLVLAQTIRMYLITTTGSKISCTQATTLISSSSERFRHLRGGTSKKTFPRMAAQQWAHQGEDATSLQPPACCGQTTSSLRQRRRGEELGVQRRPCA